MHLAAILARTRACCPPACGSCAADGATLAVASARTGISVSTLSRLESGVPRADLDLLLPLARAYRVTLDQRVDPGPYAVKPPGPSMTAISV